MGGKICDTGMGLRQDKASAEGRKARKRAVRREKTANTQY